MSHGFLSVKSRCAYGNVAIGLCLIALGMVRLLNPTSLLVLGAAICLLLVCVASLLANSAPRREMPDEMSEVHDGHAAGHALRITLIVTGLLCAASMCTSIKVDLATTGLGFVGFGLLVYGIVFGWLER